MKHSIMELDNLTIRQKIYIAKKWGRANGYKGKAGWIFSPSGKPVCNGWLYFFYKLPPVITVSLKQKGSTA